MSINAFALSVLAVIVSGELAYYEGNGSSTQMSRRLRVGRNDCFPFLHHAGIWGQLVFMSPALGFMCLYMNQWSPEAIFSKLMIASAVTLILHIVWSTMTDRQEHILGPGLAFTASGLVHVIYMAITLDVVLLFYFDTPSVNTADANLVTVLLLMHIPTGIAFVGYCKSRKFDAPGVAATAFLMTALVIVRLVRF